jgi:hypothetical protein
MHLNSDNLTVGMMRKRLIPVHILSGILTVGVIALTVVGTWLLIIDDPKHH